MLGDDEHPISFRFVPRYVGAHVHVVVWAGHREGGRGRAGELTFRPEEWSVLAFALGMSSPVDKKLGAMLRYAPPHASSRLEGVKLVHIDVDQPFELDPLAFHPEPIPYRSTPVVAESRIYTCGACGTEMDATATTYHECPV